MSSKSKPATGAQAWGRQWLDHVLSAVQSFRTETTDPSSVIDALGDVAAPRGLPVVVWDIVRGMRGIVTTTRGVSLASFPDLQIQLDAAAAVVDGRPRDHTKPADALSLVQTLTVPQVQIHSNDRRPGCIFVMLNFFDHFDEPDVRQELDNACHGMRLTHTGRFTPVHFVQAPYSHGHMWWMESVLHWMRDMPVPLPSRDELLEDVVSTVVDSCKATTRMRERSRFDVPYLHGLASALQGATRPAAGAILRYAARQHRGLTDDVPAAVASAVAKELASLGTLEIVPDSSIAPPEALGGVDRVVERLEEAAVSYTDEAREYHLDPPKGLWLCGVEGSGKTEAAKTTSVIFARRTSRPWRVIRVRCGAFYGGLVGDTESNWYKFEERIAAFGECVVFFDSVGVALA